MNFSYEKAIRSAIQKRDLARTLVDQSQIDFDLASENYEETKVANDLVISVATEVQRRVHLRISKLVSRCLSAVFPDPYVFEIKFETKANRSEAEIVFLRGENQVDPLSGAGGGVIDVAAFALRLACLSLRRPAVRKLLILDEPFRFVSAVFRPRVRELLENLSRELGVQIIMVTHVEELCFGNVIDMKGFTDGISSVEEIG